jgi:hypothetical protein
MFACARECWLCLANLVLSPADVFIAVQVAPTGTFHHLPYTLRNFASKHNIKRQVAGVLSQARAANIPEAPQTFKERLVTLAAPSCHRSCHRSRHRSCHRSRHRSCHRSRQDGLPLSLFRSASHRGNFRFSSTSLPRSSFKCFKMLFLVLAVSSSSTLTRWWLEMQIASVAG